MHSEEGLLLLSGGLEHEQGVPPDGGEEALSEVVSMAAEDGAEGDRDKATSRFDSMSWYGQRQRVPMQHAWASSTKVGERYGIGKGDGFCSSGHRG